MESHEPVPIWISLAKEDYRAAKTLSSGGHDSWACYLCSQSAEKCLKAMMLAAGINPGCKHSLVTMLQALVKTGVPKDEAEPLRDAAKLLTKMALTTRHPIWPPRSPTLNRKENRQADPPKDGYPLTR